MRKYFAFFLTVLFLFNFAACAKPVDNSPPDAGTPMAVDMTVDVKSFDITGKKVALNGAGQADIGDRYPNAESLIAKTEAVVTGTVLDVKYSVVNGVAVMYYDFQIDECWEGKFSSGDKITVAQDGGYIPGDIFRQTHDTSGDTSSLTKDDLVKQNLFDTPYPEAGQRYVLFLETSPDPLYEGIYRAVGGFMGKYVIDGKSVSRYQPDSVPDLYSGMKYSTDPSSLGSFKDFVVKAVSNYIPPAPPTFEEMRANYLIFIEAYRNTLSKDIEEFTADGNKEAAVYSQKILDNTNAGLDDYIAFYDNMVSFVQKTAAEQKYHPRILLLSFTSPLLVAGGDTFESYLLETAGGINAAKELSSKGNFTPVTAQEIKKLDPDIIYVPMGAKQFTYNFDELMKSDEWQAVRAVKAGAVYGFPSPGGSWSSPGYTGHIDGQPLGYYKLDVCLGLAFVVSSLYPDVYSRNTLASDAAWFYAHEMEGYTFPTESFGLQ